MEVFKLIYSVLGGLGIFFYGMKNMSEALQSVAGDVVKNTINKITTNRFSAIIVGTLVTIFVQSSSVTSVMTVGFVNAGLMNLSQAIGVILGANIGTTVTGWIISIKVGKYGLLFIGLGIFPLLFAKTNRYRQIGRILFSVGMIFFGLSIMSNAFKPLRTMPEFLSMISYFSEQNYGAYFACIIVGCILTVVIQSSSAMLGITIALASSGVIQFHTAAALVLGENIGTTITALLASVGANITAKRAARAHAIFNLLGVLIIFLFFPFYVEFIDYLVPGAANAVNAEGDFVNVAVHIASGHTIFNVAATVIFIPFLNQLANFVTKITPATGEKEQHHLVMLGDPSQMVTAAALAQAQAEVNKMKDIVSRLYALAEEIYIKQNFKDQERISLKAKDYERITDNIQKEVTIFIVKLMVNPLSEDESRRAQSMIKEVDELESIADYIERLIAYSARGDISKLIRDEAKKDFDALFVNVKAFYDSVSNQILLDRVDYSVAERKSKELRDQAEQIRKKHLDRVSSGEYDALGALTYSDMIVALRKIRSHTENAAQAHV
ncbi:Na/Pi-cotransporter II-like protein [Bacteriovorax sp. BAL6_X]|uniref:Na/Pi cotransporter family protein n=1 Tax=Bacteriovorax sp. BAL6_X TaxID=1201290 RepID=UPI000386CFF3|nr:Na/Pi cotransporter family protein [Bacteriovorax sp. BAL6_X]EPZ49806.1 Na/Pi-cotransporter II-like protein [Bacteriovorax sp. BAL6_X]